jgi:YVTN family beta-propeller protein
MLLSDGRLPSPLASACVTGTLAVLAPQYAANAAPYEIFASNEKSGDITVISSAGFRVLATIPAGKRPRGIHASPDGHAVYVALSGTPIEAPPEPDAKGNPILRKHVENDDDEARRPGAARASARDPLGSDEHSYAWLFSPPVRKLTSSNISFSPPVGGNNLLKHHN